MSESIVIVSAARTPMGAFQGDFSSLAAHDLGGAAIKAAVERAGIPGDAVGEVLFGNCLMAGQGQAPARQAAFKGGLPKSAGALDAGGGECVLRFARELVFGGAIFAKGAHGTARLIGILEAIQHHVVVDAVVANPDATAALEQQVRRVGHALHPAGHHHLVGAGQQHVVREHRRLHARAAHLRQRHRARAFRQAALERRLTRRGLALAGHQAIAE